MASADEFLSKGRRNLACGEISQAVENFQKACELLAGEHGDLDERLAVPNLLYGTALLELARMESTVIGNALEGVPEDDASSESDEECDLVEKGPEMTAEEKEELSNQVIDAMCEKEKLIEDAPKDDEVEQTKAEDENGKPVEEEPKNEESNEGNEDEKNDTGDEEDAEAEEEGTEEPEPGVPEGEQDEDDVTNLQLAWEVIEVAKRILSAKDDQESRLKVAECYEKLGEISREKEDYPQAISDLKECLSIRQSLLSDDNREIAETHFQIGTTHAVAGDLELAVSSFESAIKSLKQHTTSLTEKIAAKSVEGDENELDLMRSSLKEVEGLISEVEKRKVEVEEDVAAAKLTPGPSTTSMPKSTTTNGSQSVDDISHLIRKKRQVTENRTEKNVDPVQEANADVESPKTKKLKLTGDAVKNGTVNGGPKDAMKEQSVDEVA